MRSSTGRRAAQALVVAAALAGGLGACGSSDSPSSGTGTDKNSNGADVAAARKLIAPFVGHPNSFPVDKPLPKPLPAGAHVAYLQCGTPACGLFAELYKTGLGAMGARMSTVKAGGNTSEALQGAMNSILEKRPDGILVPGIEAASISSQLSQAKSQGIPISANGIADSERYGIGAVVAGRPSHEMIGRLLAGWVVSRKADKGNAVMYIAPELSFTEPIRRSFAAEMDKLCPSCEVRVVKIPAASMGTTAPSSIVSDLQSHSKSNVAVFVPHEIATGLAAALNTAGLKITQVGFGPTPPILADIKKGAIDAGLGLDIPTMTWTQLDALARLIQKAPLVDRERSTIPVMQFLEAKDLTGDVSKGWTGYPDFAERLQKLWKPGS